MTAVRCSVALACLLPIEVATGQSNTPPSAPVIQEPVSALPRNPFDVHMETAPFADVDAGSAETGRLDVLAGSMTGTSPGTPFGGVAIPLVLAGDPWFSLVLTAANSPALPNSIGILDQDGQGASALVLTAGAPAALVGLQLHHAFVVCDLGLGRCTFASNAVPLTLLP